MRLIRTPAIAKAMKSTSIFETENTELTETETALSDTLNLRWGVGLGRDPVMETKKWSERCKPHI